MAESTKDFEELLESLTRHGVRFVVVGAHAIAHHAVPRYTKDLDLFVEPDHDNGTRLVRALEQFGFGGIGIVAEDFDRPGRIVQLGTPPNRVDLLTSIDGVTFPEVWDSRVDGAYGSVRVPFIGYQALVRNKTASARAQDLADLEILKQRKP
ncbi:MAG TPA: nucleotidyltransferase [Thermoanaerobaculia bacterium]|nr:nucleotidyltransferase [Thermoanaerobaculia bacterium]